MTTPSRAESVPKSMQPTFEAVVALTDAFCRDHLDEEHRLLARRMAAALSRKRPSPLSAGQPKTWACGIVHLIGRLNPPDDRARRPFRTMVELCAAFGVAESTTNGKAKVIATALKADWTNPEWMLPSRLPKNRLVWMAVVDGVLVDPRDMPQEMQEIAHGLGLLPSLSGAEEPEGGR